MARKLRKKGCTIKTARKSVRIKVANGKRSMLKDTMTLKLQFGPETSEEIEFLILEDLPFDFILGHEKCIKWKGILNWQDATFSITPREGGNRVELEWNVYRGQHWRSPVLFIARENTVLKP